MHQSVQNGDIRSRRAEDNPRSSYREPASLVHAAKHHCQRVRGKRRRSPTADLARFIHAASVEERLNMPLIQQKARGNPRATLT